MPVGAVLASRSRAQIIRSATCPQQLPAGGREVRLAPLRGVVKWGRRPGCGSPAHRTRGFRAVRTGDSGRSSAPTACGIARRAEQHGGGQQIMNSARFDAQVRRAMGGGKGLSIERPRTSGPTGSLTSESGVVGLVMEPVRGRRQLPAAHRRIRLAQRACLGHRVARFHRAGQRTNVRVTRR